MTSRDTRELRTCASRRTLQFDLDECTSVISENNLIVVEFAVDTFVDFSIGKKVPIFSFPFRL